MMRWYLTYWYLLGFLILPNVLFAQWDRGLSFQAGYHYGQILRHTPKLTIPIPTYSDGFELDIQLQHSGSRDWEIWRNYPRTGILFQYMRPGNEVILGHAFALMPDVSLPILRAKAVDMYLELGYGVAYLSQHYNAASNPINNAIGSHLNIAAHLKAGLDWRLSAKWALSAGFAFTHFSNGASQLPNYGLNIASAFIAGRFSPSPIGKGDFIRGAVLSRPSKRWGADLYGGIAWNEILVPGGPRYPVYIASLSGVYRPNRFNSLRLGMEFERHMSVYYFGLLNNNFQSRREARDASYSTMVFAGEEFMFGKVGLLLQGGVYLKKVSLLTSRPYYEKLALRYYFPPLGKTGLRFHTGVYLKAHFIVAEYFAFCAGILM